MSPAQQPPAVDVVEVTAAELQWPFRASGPSYNGHGCPATDLDPFPAYPHDIQLVEETLAQCLETFEPLTDLVLHVSKFEDQGRTNGWATKQYVNIVNDAGDREWSYRGHIFLSGKRIPPHPAVTRYVVAHEFGHQVQWWLGQAAGDTDGEALMADYRRVRGLADDDVYGGGTWHLSPGEVFACDFRILVAGIETDYWPHDGVAHPLHTLRLRRWWAAHLADRAEAA